MSVNPIRATSALAIALVALLASPADAAKPDAISPPAAGRYVDAYEYMQSDAQFEAWYRVVSGLRHDFDQVCGDTFCEGDYSNIQSLRYRCSVDRVSGRVGQCVWVLAGSMEEVDPATGRIVVSANVWRCRSPIGRLVTLEDLLRALDVPSAIHARLPGGDRSLYDGLVDCL